MARSYGCWAAGPITEADNLGPALHSAAKEAADGAVAVVHVRTGHS
jgi:acetolactate synthase-1/2/3 large subunit